MEELQRSEGRKFQNKMDNKEAQIPSLPCEPYAPWRVQDCPPVHAGQHQEGDEGPSVRAADCGRKDDPAHWEDHKGHLLARLPGGQGWDIKHPQEDDEIER